MDETTPGARRRVLAACALAAMVAGLVYAASRGTMTRPDPEAAAPADVAIVTAPRVPSTAPPADGAGTMTERAGIETPPEEAPPAVAADPAVPPPVEAPRFDVVRVSPDGSALVAGRAAPGSMVTILADAAPLAEAEADAEGNFVAIFQAEPSAVPQALTLEAESADGGSAASEDVVMLFPEAPGAASGVAAEEGEDPAAVPAGGSAAPAEAATVPADLGPAGGGGGVAAADQAAPSGLTEAPGTAAAESGAAESVVAGLPEGATQEGRGEPSIAATAIVRRDEVAAAPTVAAPGGVVTLASISYAEEGQITLAGLGKAGAVLRVYVDDAFAREAEVGADGRWTMELADVAAGVYRLRIDQLGANGGVASRVETPFQRDYPRAPVPRPGAAPAGSVTVQPGNNLWTLARLHYGSGVLYTQIFTANRGLIRDPDLIYPGQIFAMPEVADE